MDYHAAGNDAARKRVAAGAGAAAASAVRSLPRELGDRRRAPPLPPPRAAEGRRGDVGGSGAAATRDSRRGAGPGNASRGGGASRSGVVALAGVADASPGDDTPGAAVAVGLREGTGGDEVGSKKMVSASRRDRPGCGRGADDSGSRLVPAPERSGLGGSASVPKKPGAPPPRSVGEAGSSAAVVPRPIARGGHHNRDAGALRSPEPSRRRSVDAADGFLDTESQGGSGSGGFGSGKPTMDSATRRLGTGRGRVTASQPLDKSADKRPCTESNELSTARGSSTHFRMRVASACTMGSIKTPDDVAASILQDDGFIVELIGCERKLELKFNVSSDVLSAMHQKQHGTQNADARSKVKMMCERFQFICRATAKFVEQHSLKVGRIDLTADKVIKKLPGFTQHDPIIGNVPGVQIGDEFVYRVELALVGLHRPYRGGIGTTRDENGVLVAVSIVASGGYPDEISSSGVFIYTGSGGKLAGKKGDENQKLKMGNRGLKNCIQTRTAVRVIFGLKRSRGEGNHPRANKGASAFTYDGLYHVLHYWMEGQEGSKVFKYKLQRIPGQPQLPYCSKTVIMCPRRRPPSGGARAISEIPLWTCLRPENMS